jgi:hypothetical protein
MRSNCVVWAVLLYLRRRERGRSGYLMLRKSRHGWFPHCLYAEWCHHGLRVVSYVPLEPEERKCPPPAFVGRSKWGDLS